MPKRKAVAPVLPEGVQEIYKFHQLPEKDIGSVCGLVVDFLRASKSKGTDYQKSITIRDNYQDPNPDASQRKPSILTVKLFADKVALLPPVERLGDVILFKRLKRVTWQAEVRGLSAWDTTFVFFPNQGLLNPSIRHGHEVVDPHGKAPFVRPDKAGDVSKELQDYAEKLGQRLREQQDNAMGAVSMQSPTVAPRSDGVPSLPARPQLPASSGHHFSSGVQQLPTQQLRLASFYDQRYRQIKDLSPDAYSATIVGEIVKLFDSFNYLDVYVTDYTSSPYLYDRKEAINSYNNRAFPGPLGKMTLKIEVHNPHRDEIRVKFSEKEIVMFRNVRCKMANSGEGLEATLWPDRKFPEKIHVVAPDSRDARVVQIMEKRASYYGTSSLTGSKAGSEENRKSALYKKKKEKKIRKERERQEAEQRVDKATRPSADNAQSRTDLAQADGAAVENPQEDVSMAEEEQGLADTLSAERSCPPWANQRILTTSSHQFSSFAEVLNNPKRQVVIPLENRLANALIEVPFVNVNHRVLLRIVDYYPKDVWNFAMPIERPSDPVTAPEAQYHWDLTLLAIGGNRDRHSMRDGEQETISIHVDDEAGRTLFGVSAHSIIYDEEDQKTLAKAQEKFFTLVGSELPNAKEASSGESSVQTSPTQSRWASEQFRHWERQRTKVGYPAVSLPFEACIREFGVRCEVDSSKEDHSGCDECQYGWKRVYGLHSTMITESDRSNARRGLDEGKTLDSAIVIDDSDVEMTDPV